MPPVTAALIAINVAVFVLQTTYDDVLVSIFALWPFGRSTSAICTPASASDFGSLSATPSYWLSRRFGRLVQHFWPLRQHPERLKRGIAFFERYGGISVFLERFLGRLRATMPTAAGIMHMPTCRFYAANISSAMIWAPALVCSCGLLASC
jgi:membrane protein YqaA with SNARE-associated domain